MGDIMNLIDIRDKEDYMNNNIKGSINIPRLKLLNDPKQFLDKNKIYYLICDMGVLSESTSKILNVLGYNCISVKGGIKEYKK